LSGIGHVADHGSNRVTGELGDTRQPIKESGAMAPTYQGGYGGSGATTVATGLDLNGRQSVVEFGFIDYSGPTPVNYVEGIGPASGQTDVLGTLVDFFNLDYAAAGFTASYDPSTDMLKINQPLSATDMLFEGDSDTGTELAGQMTLLPEPSTFALFVAGTVAAGCRRRRCATSLQS